MTPTQDERALREAVVAALEAVGKDTGHALAALRHRARANRRTIRALAALTAMLVVTIGAMIAVVVTVSAQTTEIDGIQRRTSDKVLCPLYGAFLAAENNPVPKEIAKDPAQVKERKEAFRVIRIGYVELGCDK